jgi:glutamate-1-semialdehyde 2,1-aminomutase
LVEALNAVITRLALPWHVTNVGARVELICSSEPPKNGSEARATMDHELESLLHLTLVNRGSLLAPFHNMMLVSPVTNVEAVEGLVDNFTSVCATLLRASSRGLP